VQQQPPLSTDLDATTSAAGAATNGEAPDTVAAHLAKGERRGPDTIWRANPREQGLIGLTDAIAWFGANGYDVLLPLIDSQPYDLVVDGPDGLQKVQVKTTTCRSPYGVFVVRLCTSGGNQSFHTRKPFDPSLSDLLYVLTDDGTRYVIPTATITTANALNLGDRVASYRVAAP
jgi:hypothetical protein